MFPSLSACGLYQRAEAGILLSDHCLDFWLTSSASWWCSGLGGSHKVDRDRPRQRRCTARPRYPLLQSPSISPSNSFNLCGSSLSGSIPFEQKRLTHTARMHSMPEACGHCSIRARTVCWLGQQAKHLRTGGDRRVAPGAPCLNACLSTPVLLVQGPWRSMTRTGGQPWRTSTSPHRRDPTTPSCSTPWYALSCFCLSLLHCLHTSVALVLNALVRPELLLAPHDGTAFNPV